MTDNNEDTAVYAPDYGLAMLALGTEDDATISFMPFRLSHISMVEEGWFTTAKNVPIGEVEHALSVDISAPMLGNILLLGPDETTVLVMTWLRKAAPGMTLELPTPLSFNVSLVFGEVQGNDEEAYLPLVIKKFWACIEASLA